MRSSACLLGSTSWISPPIDRPTDRPTDRIAPRLLYNHALLLLHYVRRASPCWWHLSDCGLVVAWRDDGISLFFWWAALCVRAGWLAAGTSRLDLAFVGLAVLLRASMADFPDGVAWLAHRLIVHRAMTSAAQGEGGCDASSTAQLRAFIGPSFVPNLDSPRGRHLVDVVLHAGTPGVLFRACSFPPPPPVLLAPPHFPRSLLVTGQRQPPPPRLRHRTLPISLRRGSIRPLRSPIPMTSWSPCLSWLSSSVSGDHGTRNVEHQRNDLFFFALRQQRFNSSMHMFYRPTWF